MKQLYILLILGKEKAVTGFLVSGALTALALIGINGNMTIRDALAVGFTAILTYLSVFYKANK